MNGSKMFGLLLNNANIQFEDHTYYCGPVPRSGYKKRAKVKILVDNIQVPEQRKIFVAGSEGMVGSSLVRCLREAGYHDLLCTSRSDLDLTDQAQTALFFDRERPDLVVLAAAKVGGILANSGSRADFIYENLMIESNVIHSAFRTKVKKLICLGSSCIYPRMAVQPIKEEYLLSGPLEPTNES